MPAFLPCQKTGGDRYGLFTHVPNDKRRKPTGMRNSLSRQHQRSHALPVTARRMQPGSGSCLAKPLTLAAMSLGYGVVQLDVTIVNTALNSIGNSLGGSNPGIAGLLRAMTQ